MLNAAALVLLASAGSFVTASPARLDSRGPPNQVQMSLCSAQLKAFGAAASSFCTSFVGGVATKTSTVSVSTSMQVTQTNTITQNVAGPTVTATFTDTATVTSTPDAQTVTSTATITVSSAGPTVDYGSTCGVTQTSAARLARRDAELQDRGFLDPFQIINVFGRNIIDSACSSYVIKTPTATATTTSTKTGTITVPATTYLTGAPTTVTDTQTSTETQTLSPVTATYTSTATITDVSTACVTGRSCNDGICGCASGQAATSTIDCPSIDARLAYGLTGSGPISCSYGYASANGAVAYCVYDPSTGNLSSKQIDEYYGSDDLCPPSVDPFTIFCS